MKFTDGYWMVKKDFTPIYAAEYAAHTFDGKELVVTAPQKHIAGRGDCLNIGMLTFHLTSPAEDVIRVEMTHFEGEDPKGPFAAINEASPAVELTEDADFLYFKSGSTTAVVDKRPNSWGITFKDGDRELTGSGWRTASRMFSESTQKSYMVEALRIDVGEYIYGLGERFTPFVKNGQNVDMWNEDGGTASEITYKNIPFYITNKGYGVLVDNEGDVSYEIGTEKVENIQFSCQGERLAYYVVNGHTPMGTVQKYTELTGKPALPPAWTFGLWLTTSFTTNYDEKTTSSYINEMAERNIPLHVFHFDCYWMDAFKWCDFTWDKKTFEDPKAMLKRYHEKGLHICVWINSYIAQQSYLFKEGKENGYLLKKKDGSVWQTDLWQPGMAIVDFTNPAAVAWYQSKLKELLDVGVDCFKTDFGERIPVKDVAWFDGSDPVKMHNYYTFLYNKTVFELLERERGKGEACLFARSATVGGQQFPVHWGGDSTATYYSMAETLRGGLSLACDGFGFWSHDISGFENTAPADLYKRWVQFGLMGSHSRLHGSGSIRVPWAFDEESCDVLRAFVNLKCRLMPYFYRYAAISHETGAPVMRPLFMQFPGDRACETLDREFMIGDNLLVAPIFREDGKVEYYVPDGKWFNILTGKTVEGGHWVTEQHDYFTLPVLARENSIIPFGSNDQRPDYDYTEGLTVKICNFQDGAETTIEIPDLQGKTVASVTAKRTGDTVKVTTEGKITDLKVEICGAEELKVEL